MNAYKHGRYTAEAFARRREISELIRVARALESNSPGDRRVAYQSRFNELRQTILAPKRRRRHSDQFSKHAVQLGCIAKPHRERHVGDR